MKKALIVVAVLALTMVSSVALADITVSGSVDFRGRATNNLDGIGSYINPATGAIVGRDYDRFNESRVSLTADGKMGDAKAKLTIWTDWEVWGGLEASNAGMVVKEAWADFPLFGIFRAKYGHMPLMLSNGWFFRHMYRGDDAWVLYGDAGGSHFGLVNIKIAEAAPDNDADIYALVFTQKAGDSVFGANLARVVFTKGSMVTFANPNAGSNILHNLGAHATVAAGPAKLNIEFDYQMGTNKDACTVVNGICTSGDYAGNQIVIQGTVPAGAATVNFTAARGTGNKAAGPLGAVTADTDAVQTYLDITNKPNYTFVYDYLLKTAGGAAKRGFQNTTALGVGADVKAGKATVGASFFYLQATEKVALNGATDALGNPILSSDAGMELDVTAKYALADTVAATLYAGYFMPGDAYKYNKVITPAGLTAATDADEATALMFIITAGLK